MAEALEALLPRILQGPTWKIYEHRSKADLLKKLALRLRGYTSSILPTTRIIVLVDRDGDECTELKAQLEAAAQAAGLPTKSRPTNGQFSVITRIVIEELEAWYFGDWEAVKKAYPKVKTTVPQQAKYRNPDKIKGGTWEAFQSIMQTSGYFKTGLRKVEAARAIAQHMNPERNSSPSFQHLRAVFRAP